MDLATHPLKWTVNDDGQWVRLPFVRDERGDHPAPIDLSKKGSRTK